MREITGDGRRAAKAATRRRIVDAAAALFRRDGIDAVGVDAVMRAAGLTHGGFYAHFASKEALVAEACADALNASADRWRRVAEAPDRAAAVARLVETYLAPGRLTATERGCVLPLLAGELARRPDACAALDDAMRTMMDTLAPADAGAEGGADRQAGMAALATMVGAVALARLAQDPAFAEEILNAARARVLGEAG